MKKVIIDKSGLTGLVLSPKVISLYATKKYKGFKAYFYVQRAESYFKDYPRYDRVSEADAYYVDWFEITVGSLRARVSDKNLQPSKLDLNEIKRDDPLLIEAIEELGLEESNFKGSELKIVKIPNKVKWVIKCHDQLSYEWVAEKHRTWD